MGERKWLFPFRDRVAVVICNGLLRVLASKRYRTTLKAVIVEGMTPRDAILTDTAREIGAFVRMNRDLYLPRVCAGDAEAGIDALDDLYAYFLTHGWIEADVGTETPRPSWLFHHARERVALWLAPWLYVPYREEREEAFGDLAEVAYGNRNAVWTSPTTLVKSALREARLGR